MAPLRAECSEGVGRGSSRGLGNPVAGLNVRPGHVSEKEYYALPVENLCTYPVYYPGREPEG